MSAANDLTTQIIDYIYSTGGFAFRASSTGIFDKKLNTFRTAPKKGVSDVLGIYKGRFIACEVKIGRDSASPEQIGFLKNIEHYGGLTFMAKDFPSFKEWYDQYVIHTTLLTSP
jgi:penicillin-binding protein-related factor A (putative recombinase)